MKKLFLIISFVLTSTAFGQSPGAIVYVKSNPDGFAPAITAAILKKGTPVQVVTNPKDAGYEISYSLLSKKGSPGAQVAAGVLAGAWWIGRASVTVSFVVTDLQTGAVVYSYTVHKAGNGSRQFQSAAEAFAKHWKHWIEHKAK